MSHSVEQLWSEPIAHGMPWVPGNAIPEEFRNHYVPVGKRIRPVVDSTADDRVHASMDWGTRLDNIYIEYCARAAAHTDPWWKPKLNGNLDKFRYMLHRTLLRWKIII